MHDRLDILISNQFLDECLILNVALHKSDVLRDGTTKASGEIVDDGNAIAGIAQRHHGMAANISRAARYQYNRLFRHVLALPVSPQHTSRGFRERETDCSCYMQQSDVLFVNATVNRKKSRRTKEN